MFGTLLAQTLSLLRPSLDMPASSTPSFFPPPLPSSQHLGTNQSSSGRLVPYHQTQLQVPESINPTSASIKSVSLQVEDSIAISSDLDGVVKIWDISMGLCKASFQTPAKDPYWRDARMIDGRLIFVWLRSGGINIWDAEKGELLQMVDVAWGYLGALEYQEMDLKFFSRLENSFKHGLYGQERPWVK
jgi:WD40 repeat protein